MALWVVALALVVMAAGFVYIRTVPSDPAIWHADPLAAARTGRPNDFLVLPPGAAAADLTSPVYEVDAATLAQRFDAVAMGAPRVTRLAGGPQDLWTTYIQRSAMIGWPDYISVKAVDLGEGRSALAVWSRSRFGYSDLGVNRARAETWLAAPDLRG
jgi:uncharacterized protein (DUF1499 family)